MNILVTGACGYKGTVLIPKLLDAGHNVVAVDVMWFGNYLEPHINLSIKKNDIRNIQEIELSGIDVVIHLAAIANDPAGDLNPKLTWEVNTLATMQLIDKSYRNKVKHFIYASSGSVYGIKQEINLGSKNNQNFVSIPFGMLKQKLETKCDYYGINYILQDQKN